jgi:hypothetical protein
MLFDCEWQKCQVAGAFDCDSHPSLVFAAISVAAGRINLVPAVQVMRKSGYIFVVDLSYLCFAKIAFFSLLSKVCHKIPLSGLLQH